MVAFPALHLYRMKDVVEKAFGNIKERLNMRRLLSKSEYCLESAKESPDTQWMERKEMKICRIIMMFCIWMRIISWMRQDSLH